MTYQLPYGTAFKSPHSGERNWRTANQNLILLSEAGSRLHGINIGGDDQDLQGVCIEPPEVMLGTQHFELYEYRTQSMGARSGEGDIDLSCYGMAKWVRLICDGNPSHLLPLFAPNDKILAIGEAGQELRNNLKLFLAKDHAQKFLGYLNSQRMRMLGQKSQRTNRPELIEKYGYDCYLDDTEFLTRRGWLQYAQVTDADEIATINQSTGALQFQHFTDRVTKPYSGPIFISNTRYSKWAVTPNHRMWVSQHHRGPSGHGPATYDPSRAIWSFRRADEVNRLTWYQQVAASPAIVEYPVSDAHLALVGAYVSKGTVDKRRKDGRASVLRFEQKDSGRLHATMALVGQQYSLRRYCYPEKRPVTIWTLADVDVANELAKSCGEGSAHKHLPSWAYDLSGRQSNVLIEAMMNGDGTPYRTGGWVYYSQSQRLADDIQVLALLAGRRANVRGPYKPDGTYQVLIHDAGSCPYAILHGRQVKKTEVQDRKIVCFTVPNETLVTRRDGHVAMHGNTKFASHALRIAIQGIQLMKTGLLTLPMEDHERKYLIRVREGEYTQGEILAKLGRLEEELLHAGQYSVVLNQHVDYDYVNGWLVDVYQRFWKEKGLA